MNKEKDEPIFHDGEQIYVDPTALPPRVYRSRWLVLLMFVCYSMSNAFNWTQYVIITDVIMKYHDVSSFDVEATSLVYMITYVIFIVPATWFLGRQVQTLQYNPMDSNLPFQSQFRAKLYRIKS